MHFNHHRLFLPGESLLLYPYKFVYVEIKKKRVGERTNLFPHLYPIERIEIHHLLHHPFGECDLILIVSSTISSQDHHVFVL